MKIKIYHGNSLNWAKKLKPSSIDCVVTSPPYYRLRDYGVKHQVGAEETPELYVKRLVRLFRHIRKALKDSGVVWLNLGDGYNTGAGGRGSVPENHEYGKRVTKGLLEDRGRVLKHKSIKPKDILGIPWRVAFALQEDGWYLRQDIIWAKPNPMPESVNDRCAKSHEYIFLLSKKGNYYFDAEAIKEPAICADPSHVNYRVNGKSDSRKNAQTDEGGKPGFGKDKYKQPPNRNKRSIWTVATQSFGDAHFATFPKSLIEPMIKAGVSEKGCCPKCGAPWHRAKEKIGEFQRRWSKNNADGSPYNKQGSMQNVYATKGWEPSCTCKIKETVPCTVLDPFFGSGTTGIVANTMGANCIGIELNKKYIDIATKRIQKEAGIMCELKVVRKKAK